MKVKLLVSRSGVNGAQNVGDEIEIDNDEAIRMIDAGQAAPVRMEKPEKAIKRNKPEKAVK